MSYNNSYGGFSSNWDPSSIHQRTANPIGDIVEQDDVDSNQVAASGVTGWNPDQYLPEDGTWNQQQEPSQWNSSSRTEHQPHRPKRYEPYQISNSSHPHPHHAHLPTSSEQPIPFPDFDLSNPSSFLLPDQQGSLPSWQNNQSIDTERRESDSTRSGVSGGGGEHDDLPVASSSNFNLQKAYDSLPSFGLGDPRTTTQQNGKEAEGEKAGDKKLVKKADKSCRKCRDRRVRCDRVYPVCDRCRKRREVCNYVDTVNVDEFEEGGDAQKVVELQSKVAALERQLKASTSSNTTAPPSTERRPSLNRDNPASHRSGSGTSGSGSRSGSGSGSGSNPSRTPPTPSEIGPSSIINGIGEIYSNQLRFKQDETVHLISHLMGMHSIPNLGHTNPNWRLGETEVMKQLTIHLLDAATRACCANIPGIKPLADQLDYYKANLDKLDGAGQCAVAVLCALGARASPHSALLGVATQSLADASPSPPLFLYAGERREIACRALERRAREVCWVNGMLESTNLSDLDAIIGVTQVLIYEEIVPQKSRLFTRIAAGMYHDLRFKAVERKERTGRDPRIGPGTALFLADAVIAASSSRPSFISTSELENYYVTDGVPIPDFPGSNLLDELDKILQRPLNKEKLTDAITQGIIWVSGCARLFAQLTMSRRPSSPSPLPLLKNLWTLIDSVHNSLQHLQSIFVHLDQTQVADLDDSPYALDHFVLLGVRADSILVDLINLMHIWLKKDRNGEGIWTEGEGDPLLASMRQESALRVRKCLKLSAFYAQLFLSSQDKHLVHHMMMQLEILNDWSEWVLQRVGTPGGPPSAEYEITETELDWFQRALELSCYYTPKAANRLSRFSALRREEAKRPSARLHVEPLVPAIPLDTIIPQQTVYDNPSYINDISSSGGQDQDQSGGDDQLFPLGGGLIGTPSQLFVFDTYGIASQQGWPAGTQDAVSSDSTFKQGFTGESWLSVEYPDNVASGAMFGEAPENFLPSPGE
ncbi:uncharacterized protein JCM6883_005956 [Sporobolomyces salmoneus]|uniref:uncharacterized protein n=1 Tax=Sporobolomyces salmoneus TaxID=183962 RepID=UPI00316E3F4B